jgi:hypothetical protein
MLNFIKERSDVVGCLPFVFTECSPSNSDQLKNPNKAGKTLECFSPTLMQRFLGPDQQELMNIQQNLRP